MSSAPWQTESIRFSAFGEALVPGHSLLPVLLDVQPEAVNERPAQSFRQETARHAHFRLTITRSPGRLDLLFADLTDANTSDPTRPDYKPFFEIGDYDDVFPPIRARIHQLVARLQNPIRLAYAPTLFAPTRTLKEATHLLAGKLSHVHFDPENDTDVFWQINRPRVGKISPLRLNRISKWHTIAVQRLQITPPIARIAPDFVAAAARVEIDVNTPADNSEALVHVDATSVADELMSLAHELFEKGDIP